MGFSLKAISHYGHFSRAGGADIFKNMTTSVYFSARLSSRVHAMKVGLIAYVTYMVATGCQPTQPFTLVIDCTSLHLMSLI